MFRCQQCDKMVPPGTKCIRVVVEKRRKEYPYRGNSKNRWNRGRQGKWRDTRGDDKGGVGYEAVHESMMCPECAATFLRLNESK